MLTPSLKKRIIAEVPEDGQFELETTQIEFLNAAKYLHDDLKASDDDVINMLRGLYVAVAEEYGA